MGSDGQAKWLVVQANAEAEAVQHLHSGQAKAGRSWVTVAVGGVLQDTEL